jgi:hypothetical protein
MSLQIGLLQRFISQVLKQGFIHFMVNWMLKLRNTNSNIRYYTYPRMVGHTVAIFEAMRYRPEGRSFVSMTRY